MPRPGPGTTGSGTPASPAPSSTPSSSWTSRACPTCSGAFFGDDIFSGGRRGARPRGGDAAAAIELTLSEAAFGVTRDVGVDIIAACERCAGSGAEPGTHAGDLRRVRRAAGHVQHVAQTAFGQFVQTSPCAGLRRPRRASIESPCTRVPRARPARGAHEAVEVQVPGGHRRPASGCACPAAATPASRRAAGDLYVQRHGRAPTRASSARATTWCRCSTCPSPARRSARRSRSRRSTAPSDIEVRPGTQPGEVLVLRGKGIPVLGGRGRGDHRVVVERARAAQALRRAALPARAVRGDGRRRHLRRATTGFLDRLRAAFR